MIHPRSWSCFCGSVLVMAMAAVLVTAGSAQAQPPPAPYLGDGDLNGDARMDEQDLLKFIQYWRAFVKNGTFHAEADFNDNGVLDHGDAAWIIGEFLRLYDVYHPGSSSASTSGVVPAQKPGGAASIDGHDRAVRQQAKRGPEALRRVPNKYDASAGKVLPPTQGNSGIAGKKTRGIRGKPAKDKGAAS